VPDIETVLDKEMQELVTSLTGLGVKVGWECGSDLPQASSTFAVERLGLLGCGEGRGFGTTMSQILGWLIIGLSVTLGAQFWFDLFQRRVA
jgi:hypothetical protein